MSNQRFSITPALAAKDKDLPDSVFRTLAVIGIYGDQQGWCWPRQSVIANLRGVSRKTVNQHIKILVDMGYLNVRPRYDEETGAQKSNMMQVKFDYGYQNVTGGVTPKRLQGVSPLEGYTGGEVQEVTHNDPINDPKEEAAVFSLFENEMGGLTPLISDDLGDLIDEYDPSWVMDAIKETSRSGAKSIKYTAAILKRWKREGKSSKPAPNGNGRIHQPDEAAAAFEVAWDCAGRGRLDTDDERIKQAARKFGFARLRQWDVNFKSTAKNEFIGIYNDIN